MTDRDQLAQQFDENRAHLRRVAFRMLGSATEAEDAVQDAWLKIASHDVSTVENLGGWLTTVVARVCLDMLRTRKSRREEPHAQREDVPARTTPEADLALADAIGPALLVVLETLAPAERVAFVLHDMFDLSFEAIAPIVDRTPTATRQLASRARRRVRGAEPVSAAAPRRELVEAFLAASRDGNLQALLAVLAPDARVHADDLAIRTAASRQQQGAPALGPEMHGAAKVAEVFKGRATAARPALIDGEPGAVWRMGGEVRAAFLFTINGGAITSVELVMDPATLAALEIELAS
ncbi:MAG TPA: sigma-70 family RNA polymerase sigma factor [Kofleriaceae bacterium]|jgi:RNA polymerase sigma-70 factor (ECF subfamily)|nr:sigma-70 family RNA polymerase sigma factor [Kofleriaceae bacterium]